jgi:hypothetical protein
VRDLLQALVRKRTGNKDVLIGEVPARSANQVSRPSYHGHARKQRFAKRKVFV